MKVLSIDIGIKNLACCLFEKSEDSELFHILKWEIVNLSQEDECKTCCYQNLEDKSKSKSKSPKTPKYKPLSLSPSKSPKRKSLSPSKSKSPKYKPLSLSP